MSLGVQSSNFKSHPTCLQVHYYMYLNKQVSMHNYIIVGSKASRAGSSSSVEA